MARRRAPGTGTTPSKDATASKASARRPKRGADIPADWAPRITSDESLRDALERLPEDPGVYIMRDRTGEVVYVGKARRLRARVRQYFSGHDTRQFVPLLAKIIGDIETIVVVNEKEALLLENTLIKQHRPRFNVKLRDDSNHLVLKLDPKGKWPRLELGRQIKHDGAWYFGPYPSARAARSTLRVINRHFKLRTCTDYTLSHRTRPCLQYQIGRCPAPCVYDVDEQQYAAQVRDVHLFMSGRHTELIDGLRQRMEQAAEALEFETAARLRDQLEAIDATLQSQRVIGTASLDQDAIGMYREGGQVEFLVMHIRQGKLLHTQGFSNRGMELPDAEVLANFVSAYYEGAPFVPDEVLLPFAVAEDDAEPLADWLWERKGKKVHVLVPERGPRKQLTTLASRNAASNFSSRRNRREDTDLALGRLQERLGLSKLPNVIECYDISHIQGSDTIGSMVVFVDGAPEKSRYRTFRIRGIRGEGGLSQGSFQNDDFASMYEVLGRRFRRALAQRAAQGEASGEAPVDEASMDAASAGERAAPTGDAPDLLDDASDPASSGADPREEPGAPADEDDPWALPDLIVIDGGKGQLGRVIAAMQDLGIPVGTEGVDLVALAKERKRAITRDKKGLTTLREQRSEDTASDSDAGRATDRPGRSYEDWVVEAADAAPETFEVRPERVFVPGLKDPILLRPGSSERYLMERVRDEAHRFAITAHRKRRGKRSLHSALDEIEGVGPATKRALVKHFGSIAAIREAPEQALVEVKGVGPALARRIREALAGG